MLLTRTFSNLATNSERLAKCAMIAGLLSASTIAWGQAIPSDVANVQLGNSRSGANTGGDDGTGGANKIQIQYKVNGQGVNQSQEGYIKFNLSVFPNLTWQNIQKATLVLYVQNGGNQGTFTVCQLAQNWSSATITGNNAPTCTNVAPVATTISATQLQQGSFITVDITSIVQSWYNGIPNYGIMLSADPTPGSNNGINVSFDSMQGNNGYPPWVNLVLQSQGPAGATGPQGPAGPAGPAGAAGANGLMGASGLPGANGNTILNGPAYP